MVMPMCCISLVLPDKKRAKTSDAVRPSPFVQELPDDITPPPSPNENSEIHRIVQLRGGRRRGEGLRQTVHDEVVLRGRKVISRLTNVYINDLNCSPVSVLTYIKLVFILTVKLFIH